MAIDPEKLPALLAILGFSMSDFFNDDGSLKSHLDLTGAGKYSLPYTLADYHHQLTNVMRQMAPAERFALLVELMCGDGDPPIHGLVYRFLIAVVGSIDAGREEQEHAA
jgi:hypothetical protein